MLITVVIYDDDYIRICLWRTRIMIVINTVSAKECWVIVYKLFENITPSRFNWYVRWLQECRGVMHQSTYYTCYTLVLCTITIVSTDVKPGMPRVWSTRNSCRQQIPASLTDTKILSYNPHRFVLRPIRQPVGTVRRFTSETRIDDPIRVHFETITLRTTYAWFYGIFTWRLDVGVRNDVNVDIPNVPRSIFPRRSWYLGPIPSPKPGDTRVSNPYALAAYESRTVVSITLVVLQYESPRHD